MTAACYKSGKSIIKNLIIIIKISLFAFKKIRLIGHIIDFMLNYMID